MATTLRTKQLTYKTVQGDIWDIVALRVYGDEHGMHYVQDANFEHRFMDAFPGGVVLNVPQAISLTNNLKSRRPAPELSQLLPWLSK
jgi:phage tail protein X